MNQALVHKTIESTTMIELCTSRVLLLPKRHHDICVHQVLVRETILTLLPQQQAIAVFKKCPGPNVCK